MILPQNSAVLCCVNFSLQAMASGAVTDPRAGGAGGSSLTLSFLPPSRREKHEQHGHPVVGHPELGLCRQHLKAEEQTKRAPDQLHTEFAAVPGKVFTEMLHNNNEP